MVPIVYGMKGEDRNKDSYQISSHCGKSEKQQHKRQNENCPEPHNSENSTRPITQPNLRYIAIHSPQPLLNKVVVSRDEN